jgi:hypothetical protein
MARKSLAEDRMTQRLLTLQESESLDSAQARLKAENRVIGVYVNTGGKVTGDSIVCADGKTRLLKTDRQTPLQTILDSPEVMSWINKGHPGIVIVEDDKPVGVLEPEPLRDYLVHEYEVHTRTAGDETLGGDPFLPLLVVTCTACGAVNQLTEFDEGRTKCVNTTPGEHPLEVAWE